MNGGMYVITWSLIEDGTIVDVLVTKFSSDEEAKVFSEERLVSDEEEYHIYKVQHEVV